MSTSGLLSVVVDQTVKLKVIAFEDGDRIPALAEWLKDNKTCNTEQIVEKVYSLFNKGCVVLQTSPMSFVCDHNAMLEVWGTPWKPNNLYAEKFNFPKYYPCLDYDCADYCEVIDLSNKDNKLGINETDDRSESLISGLKRLINESKEEEIEFRRSSQEGHANGMAYTRIKLETFLEDMGISRPSTLENENCSKRLSAE